MPSAIVCAYALACLLVPCWLQAQLKRRGARLRALAPHSGAVHFSGAACFHPLAQVFGW